MTGVRCVLSPATNSGIGFPLASWVKQIHVTVANYSKRESHERLTRLGKIGLIWKNVAAKPCVASKQCHGLEYGVISNDRLEIKLVRPAKLFALNNVWLQNIETAQKYCDLEKYSGIEYHYRLQ